MCLQYPLEKEQVQSICRLTAAYSNSKSEYFHAEKESNMGLNLKTLHSLGLPIVTSLSWQHWSYRGSEPLYLTACTTLSAGYNGERLLALPSAKCFCFECPVTQHTEDNKEYKDYNWTAGGEADRSRGVARYFNARSRGEGEILLTTGQQGWDWGRGSRILRALLSLLRQQPPQPLL